MPLARARARARADVAAAYGDRLTPAALDDLARGRLVRSLGLSRDDATISRDEFVLLLLVKQGLVSKADLDDARARFDVLDADRSGFLGQGDLDVLARRDAGLAPAAAAPGSVVRF